MLAICGDKLQFVDPISEKPPARLLYTQESIAFSLFNLKQEIGHQSKQSSKSLVVLLSWGSESL